jgi:hypothetical protein
MPGRTANVRYWGGIGLNADIGMSGIQFVVMKTIMGS